MPGAAFLRGERIELRTVEPDDGETELSYFSHIARIQ